MLLLLLLGCHMTELGVAKEGSRACVRPPGYHVEKRILRVQIYVDDAPCWQDAGSPARPTTSQPASSAGGTLSGAVNFPIQNHRS